MSEEVTAPDNTAIPPSPIPAATGAAQPPSATTPPPIEPLPATKFTRIIGRLTKIEIENYRAFRGRFGLELPEGCNLLVYGENGAGKSSLYYALNDFLENSDRYTSTVEANRHKYNTDPAVIRLGFIAASPTGDGSTITKFYECSASKNGANTSDIQRVNKGKGFLDYKSLLRVHLLPTGETEINLFELFIDPLLAQYKNPVSGLFFGSEWQRIREPFAPYRWQPYGLDKWFTDFNAGFERVVNDSVAYASKILSDHFDKEMAIEIKYTPAEYRWRPKRLTPPRIVLKLIFRRLSQDKYHEFLNEARLSALAMAIFLSGLKLSPATGYRLLVLDDILIGLDMANRMLVLGILEKFFGDWQIILFTYHKAWFEILKSRVDVGAWLHPWKSVSIRLGKAMGVACPVISEASQSLLAQARAHFAPEDSRKPDVKAAAVYARTAFEAVMSWFCEHNCLAVKYVQSRRELDTNDFLCSIEDYLSTLRNPKDREFAKAVLKEIKHARRFVLNQHSHFNPESEDEITAEIAHSIQAVEDFELLLRCLKKSDFDRADEESHSLSVGELAHFALEQLAARRYGAALDTLSRAFNQHLAEWFKSRKERLPRQWRTMEHMYFILAGERRLFGDITWLRLKHSKPYLLGELRADDLDVNAFEIAAKLLLRLRIHFLLSKKAYEKASST